MGPCCVEGCELTSEETFYFEFPTSRLLRRKWLEVIPIPGKLQLGTVVCSRHFSEDDYENVRGKVRLKRKVVPTLLLDQKKPASPKDNRPKSPTPPADATPKSPKSPSPPIAPSSQPPPSPNRPESPKVTDTCDSTTVSVPSPMDAEKMIDDIQKRMAVSIKSMMQAQHDVSRVDRPVRSPPPLDQKEDIEDMITNYHIKNKVPNPALLADLVPDVPQPGSEPVPAVPPVPPLPDPPTETIEIEDVKEAEPVFIEISVDKDARTGGSGSQDCLMLLESVQVEVDPATLMLHDAEDYCLHKREDPISLLTSSDEDDVILQEPHIDTVEVSDETDEDDMPLVKLVKKKPEKKKSLKKKSKRPRQNIEKIMWGTYDFYCVQCHFTTRSSFEYNKHLSEHSRVLQVCQICGYTSSSKSMFSRHTRIHKVEKKFKCHLCEYRARYKMSLIFHLKNHENDSNATVKSVTPKKNFKCHRCDFVTDSKVKVLQHYKSCRSEKKHPCIFCDYSTNKKCDLRRHVLRKHADMNKDDDVEFLPIE